MIDEERLYDISVYRACFGYSWGEVDYPVASKASRLTRCLLQLMFLSFGV